MTTITQALEDAKRRQAENSAEVKTLEARLVDLRSLQRKLANEVTVLEAVAARSSDPVTVSPRSDERAVSDDVSDWSDKERLWSIVQAVFDLTNAHGHATPETIEDHFAAHGRTEDKDNIGAGLSYLRKQGLLARVSRGRWVPAPAVEETEDGELF